jgi:peroxiredoxin Q/BCP
MTEETKDRIADGEIAPEFTARDQDGERQSLSDYRGQKVVLFFYPRDMTAGCTIEACDFRDNHGRILEAGAVVFGVSTDSEESHRKFIRKHNLNYSLLVDDDHSIAEAYDCWIEKNMFGKKFGGVGRTTVIIDEEGRISKIFRKVKVKGHVDEVIDVLRS